jgi:ElaB/YqjD/DUF883 family membrane-anchored ribosome-binding protein
MDERETERYRMGGDVMGEDVTPSQEVQDAVARGQETFREAKRDVKETLRGAKDRATEAYDRTASEVNRAYQGARGYAQENPGVAAAVTFAAGVGLGMMLSGRAYRRGIVPMAAVALAHAVLDVFDGR